MDHSIWWHSWPNTVLHLNNNVITIFLRSSNSYRLSTSSFTQPWLSVAEASGLLLELVGEATIIIITARSYVALTGSIMASRKLPCSTSWSTQSSKTLSRTYPSDIRVPSAGGSLPTVSWDFYGRLILRCILGYRSRKPNEVIPDYNQNYTLCISLQQWWIIVVSNPSEMLFSLTYVLSFVFRYFMCRCSLYYNLLPILFLLRH